MHLLLISGMSSTEMHYWKILGRMTKLIFENTPVCQQSRFVKSYAIKDIRVEKSFY